MASVFLLAPQSVAAANQSNETFVQDCGMSIVSAKTDLGNSILRQIPALLVDAFLSAPQHHRRVANVCEFALKSTVPYNTNNAARVTFNYTDSDYRARVYYWRKTKKEWKALPTEMNRAMRTVTADVPYATAIVSVFADEIISREGIVSWYRHKKYPYGSATNLYPTGTKLTVTNLDNGKAVDVIVTSTWTNTDDKRILDLVSTAFEKIANLRTGLIWARIEWKGYEDPFTKKEKRNDKN
ncbi:hypothetical protein HY622_02785 [Candidatus Uhrbacteria bacterium]|nr:hypothetical protein [Candidatus Uhrbacteria bacterium]